MSKRRVVVTGLGLVSPVGADVASSWDAVVAGRSGIGPITAFDAAEFPARIAGSVPAFSLDPFIPARDARRMDPFMQYGVVAALQAFRASGIEVSDANRDRIGVNMGAGMGGLATIEASVEKFLETRSPKKVSPFFVPSTIINMISGHVSIELGIRGPNLAVVTACTTSTHALGIAFRTIQYGDADVMIAGGAERGQTPLSMGSFGQAKALSTRNDEPARASRPWDRDRDGFVLSDGAGAMVLEELEHARARGADILAELVGFGMSGDAHHMTAPPEDGEGARLSMRNALRDAGLDPAAIQYLNAHATSTPLGDLAETRAIKRCFGDHARQLAVSSTKSVTGHMLGAAGVAEAIFSVLAIRDQVVPPTINLDHPDDGCDLDYVPHTARRTTIDAVLSNSFGFGGTNGTLVFRALTR